MFASLSAKPNKSSQESSNHEWPQKILGKKHSVYSLICWYIIFGAIHELFHVLSAVFLGVGSGIARNEGGSILATFLRFALGRAVNIPELVNANPSQVMIVRNTGWIASVILALIIYLISVKTSRLKSARPAAWISAVEAIITDLIGFGIRGLSPTTLLCGNFGVILINPMWRESSESSKQALKLLTKMINVTMMQGAQAGGVITWAENDLGNVYGIRSRVVNCKRTDLSRKVRDKVVEDTFAHGKIKKGIQGFYGHTRFATSSKATFDGTHPHQWTPPSARQVYRMSTASPTPSSLMVENYICHNGDFDYFRVNGHFYDLHTIQKWLVGATGSPMPRSVDSCAIAGMIDLIRTAGCFALSARFALLLGISTSTVDDDLAIPPFGDFEKISTMFDSTLAAICTMNNMSPAMVGDSKELRECLVLDTIQSIHKTLKYHKAMATLLSSTNEDEECSSRGVTDEFVRTTIDAFFDNDLLQATKYFLKNAKGSFGLFVSCSLDAHRSICIAARGQTMSIAFYPKEGLICYGSEQAAVKVGLNFAAPHGQEWTQPKTGSSYDEETVRLDLDDLGGEVCLIDWGRHDEPSFLSFPNRHLQQHTALRGSVVLVLHQESKFTSHGKLYNRMTLLSGNEFVKPLPDDAADLILADIQDIPRACNEIQKDWANVGLNRLTAWNLSRCLERRLNDRISGMIPAHAGTVEIMLTGCEVSLWLAEQFASDLQKVFPRLFVQAVSSNKLLGAFGQGLAIPSVGFSLSTSNPDLHDTIVIIVSHSGGTFAPLACSSLLQSSTKNIFVVASEWDTQIGKQLRSMADKSMTASHIFSTEIGLRPAEPCTISVAATQQLLTLIFEHICLTVLRKKQYRHLSAAVITESDLRVLERCNQDSIRALENIVGVDCSGQRLKGEHLQTEQSLRDAGKLWSNHVLENARAYVMSFTYIIVTVTIGYPIVTGIAASCGLIMKETLYITRFFDAMIYFYLPQINIIILRLVQRRHLRHRMVGRTVVIADIPWVAQAADTFLSKIFARSYSIASLHVLHGNPTDHLVHRHTHRIVRGTLLLTGRPDGRLSALTSAEVTVGLSINQASSIQSIGGTCESITIGHNPAEMSLTMGNIFLETHRPQFLCERLHDQEYDRKPLSKGIVDESKQSNTSPHFLLGEYSGWEKADRGYVDGDDLGTKQQRVVKEMIRESVEDCNLRRIFDDIDVDRSGSLDINEFVQAYQALNPSVTTDVLVDFFHEIDDDSSGCIDFDEFVCVAAIPGLIRCGI